MASFHVLDVANVCGQWRLVTSEINLEILQNGRQRTNQRFIKLARPSLQAVLSAMTAATKPQYPRDQSSFQEKVEEHP